ncbi:MAG: phosphate signaling complex protein PhoU [Aerococcus sp.]|nr:phosphate signaling complex protein PhoU [Aerococcus sp.]
MKTELRVQFKNEIEKLTDTLSTMGDKTTEAINDTMMALIRHDNQLAESVITGDIEINRLEKTIEQEFHRLVGLQSPVAYELRLLISYLKASADLERIGDHAVSISKASLTIKHNKQDADIEDALQTLGNEVSNMVEALVKTLIDMNAEDALIIAHHDDTIDNYYSNIKDQTITAMKKDPELINSGVQYLFIAANLERIADYSTNLAERIIFADNGDWVTLN